MATKAIKTFEQEHSIIFAALSDKDVERQVTEDEFREMIEDQTLDPKPYAKEDRLKFLKSNGYDVNRQTLVDSSLSHKE